MAAEQVTIPDPEDVELMEPEQLRTMLKDIIQFLKPKPTPKEAAAEDAEGIASKENVNGMQTVISSFRDKNIGKPEPWDGEDEATFKMWSEKLSAHMAGAGDKVWKKVIKYIGDMDEDDNLEAEDDIESMLIKLKIDPDLIDEMQDMLYDQLTQYTKKELLADVQMGGPEQSMESLRKAMAYGKKKTAENVHRARNRVTRPEIAETMGQLEDRYRSWKKDIAYLKDIGAYDFKDQTMVSILMDFVPDEVHKEISMKHDTAGKKASSLKTIQLMTEKIIQREKDRAESRKDRKKSGKVAAVAEGCQGDCPNHEQHEIFVWDHYANAGYGGFVAAATKRGRDDDEEAGEDGPAAGGMPAKSARIDEDGGKGGGRKGKGKGKADRECFLCGQKGHYKAHCPNRWYVPKTQWSSWWNTLPFQKGKGKGKGKDQGDGGKSKGKGKGHYSYKGQGKGVSALEYPDQEPYWMEEAWSGEEGVWNLIGAVSKVKKKFTITEDPYSVGTTGKVPSRRMHPGGLVTETSNKFDVLSDEMRGADEDKPIKISIEEFIEDKVVKKQTAVKKQPPTKKMSKMHIIAEVADEAEKDRDEINKKNDKIKSVSDKIRDETMKQGTRMEASNLLDASLPSTMTHQPSSCRVTNLTGDVDVERRDVENMFTEKGWTVKMSKRRMKNRKVFTIPWGEQCGCCRGPSAMIVPELRQEKKDEHVEKLAKLIQKNSETVEAKLAAALTVKQDALAPCTEKMSEWTKLSLAVDSGACESVIDAVEQVPGYDVQETRASKSGLVYASATGEEIPNLGEVLLPMLTKENTKRSMKMQVAEVSRPLASVKRICEAGHVVVFDEDGSFIFNKITGETNQLREESGNYMFDVWVPPKNAVATFRRQ